MQSFISPDVDELRKYSRAGIKEKKQADNTFFYSVEVFSWKLKTETETGIIREKCIFVKLMQNRKVRLAIQNATIFMFFA